MNIGDWVTRERRGVLHLVESIVSGDVVTKCGRRMPDESTKTGGPLVFGTHPAIFHIRDACRACQGPIWVVGPGSAPPPGYEVVST